VQVYQLILVLATVLSDNAVNITSAFQAHLFLVIEIMHSISQFIRAIQNLEFPVDLYKMLTFR